VKIIEKMWNKEFYYQKINRTFLEFILPDEIFENNYFQGHFQLRNVFY
jgi:hypothetical protein